ncbi:MAG: glycosyltransferase family 2 protein [Candidatus Diapherotrites archaeon]|nr:glycosyltransferase family 2 protein [Candidatus Diapherotrites archaeon]
MAKKQEKIVVIIPAHNEADTIGMLLRSLQLLKHDGVIHEIITVDDGSTDNTGKIARDYGAEVVRLPRNSGKTFTAYTGLKEAEKIKATIVVTLDGDLAPVRREQIEKLVKPVLERQCDMSIGNVREGFYRALSGQRAIRVSALRNIPERVVDYYAGVKNGKMRRRVGFGLENALNRGIQNTFWVDTWFETFRRHAERFNESAELEMEIPSILAKRLRKASETVKKHKQEEAQARKRKRRRK